jgi:acyl-CoA dehydrogenase
MVTLGWLLTITLGAIFLAYHRVSLRTATIAAGLALFLYSVLSDGGWLWFTWLALLWLAFGVLVFLNIVPLRRSFLTKRFLRIYRRLLPPMSDTEREALEAGTVWWDGEIFTGRPNWTKLLSAKTPKLSPEEQAFLDGPCEELWASSSPPTPTRACW